MSALPGAAAATPDARFGPLWQRYDYLRLLPELRARLLQSQATIPAFIGPPRTVEETHAQARFVSDVARALLETEAGRAIPQGDRATVTHELAAWMTGVGVLSPLLSEPEVNDVIVHGNLVDVRRGGQRVEVGELATPAYFEDLARLLCERLGESLDVSKRVGLVALPDQTRMTVMLGPLNVAGPSLYFRKHGQQRRTFDELVAYGALSAEAAALLQAVAGRASILLAGTPGSGKSTLLNTILSVLPEQAYVGLVETIHELQPRTRRVDHLVAEDHAENPHHGLLNLVNIILTRTLPDVLVIGEVVGPEVTAWIEAASIGRACMATAHGADPLSALYRLESLYQAAMPSMPHAAIRQRFAAHLHLVLYLREVAGRYRLIQVVALDGLDPRTSLYQMRTLQRYDAGQERFTPLANPTSLLQRLGIEVPAGLVEAAARADGTD